MQAALKEILPPLRLLMSKSRLQFADLQYVLFTGPVLHAVESTILPGRLLMVFLCDAIGGHLVFSYVVQMASKENLFVRVSNESRRLLLFLLTVGFC